jgi:hypothetical protein
MSDSSVVFLYIYHAATAIGSYMLCLGNTWTRAQHGLPLRQQNWGTYSSTSASGEKLLPSHQLTLQADVVLMPIAVYNADVLHRRSSEAFAVTRYGIWFTCAGTAPDICARCLACGDYDDSAPRHCITALMTGLTHLHPFTLSPNASVLSNCRPSLLYSSPHRHDDGTLD